MAKNSILEYSNVPDNNTDMGGIGIQGTSAVNNFDNAFRTLMSQIAEWTDGNTIASGTTTDLSTVKGMFVTVSGTSTITSFGTAKAGWMKYLRFSGAATISHSPTGIILPRGASIAVDPGDTAIVVSEGAGVWRLFSYSFELQKVLAGYISPGFNLANSATDPTNDIDFPSGSVASDGPSPILMTHVAATAQLDVAYGTGSGGRFDSTISDGTWHCFIISNGTTVSRGLSKSLDPTAQPNWPSGYNRYKRVLSIVRLSGAILPFLQSENQVDLVTNIVQRDSPAAFPAGPITLSTPTGISVQPILDAQQQQGASGNVQTRYSTIGKSPVTYSITSVAGEIDVNAPKGGIRTNTLGQIQFEVAILAGSLSINAFSLTGWIDDRGRA